MLLCQVYYPYLLASRSLKAIWGESYELSKANLQFSRWRGQTQVADAHIGAEIEEIEQDRNSMSDFRSSKYFKAISENGFDCRNFSEKLFDDG